MAGGYNEDRSRDRWRDDDRERSGWRSGGQGVNEREDERGFFERAGDEVRSWFSDDDNDRRDRDFGRRSSWDRDQNRGVSPEPSRGRDFGRDDRSSFGGMAQGGYGRSSDQFARDRERSGPQNRTFGGFRDESDFRSQRRSHPQSWGEANRGQGNWDRDRDQESFGYGSAMGGALGGFGNQRFGSSQEDHYRSWRDRQMAQLDRDYDDYCREREQQFNQDFDSWRSTRQGQASTSSASSDLGATPNAGVGTTTSSVTGTAGSGSAIGGQPMGSPEASDATTGTGTADTGGRSGSRSRS